MDEEIKKEIENLKVQACHNKRTGYPDLAEKQNQLADWLQELVDMRKSCQEAMPIRYAKWEQVDENKQKCTNCEHIFLIMAYPRCNNNFCPQCGAKIEQEEK